MCVSGSRSKERNRKVIEIGGGGIAAGRLAGVHPGHQRVGLQHFPQLRELLENSVPDRTGLAMPKYLFSVQL